MNPQIAQNMERRGKALAITGVVLFGTSLIGHLYFKDRLSAISSRVSAIHFQIERFQSKQSLDITALKKEKDHCEELSQQPDFSPLGNNFSQIDRDAFFRCDPTNQQKRATAIANLETQLKKQVAELQKPLPSLYQQGDQENFGTQAFFYSSILSLVMSASGLLMIFGRSLAYITRGGDISIGNVNHSKLPINSGHGNTAIAADEMSNLSIENNTVRSSIDHLSPISNPNAEELKQVLVQLQTLITAASELSHDDKMMALEQVKVLAQSGATPTTAKERKAADKAILVLRGIAASLPNAANLAEALNKLLPIVSSLFGRL